MLTTEQFESEEILAAVASSDDQDGDIIETPENESDETEEMDEEMEDEMDEEADEVDDVEEEA
jgi:hypothetical protein